MPAAGECEVWWARPDTARPELASLLDDGEQARYQRFVRPEDAQRYLAARALSRIVLATHLGVAPTEVKLAATCTVCGGAHGKPRVLGEPGVELSLSHSGGRVAVAVSSGDAVGVDVERLRPMANVEALADRVLAPAERPALAALPAAERPAALLGYWTRKEALLKATGDGLNVPMAELTVSPPNQPARLLTWSNARARELPAWLHQLDPGTGHVAHLAVLAGASPRVVERDGDPLLVG
ncbi:MAG: 4'-phosphopantetheinyl transferase family protein [Pseudonocardia sp.]